MSRLPVVVMAILLGLVLIACQADEATEITAAGDEPATTTPDTQPDTTEASDSGGAPPIQLAGTSWSVTDYASEATGSITNIWPGTVITLRFGSDGTLSGNAGCNDYGATFRVEGRYITEPDPLSDEEEGQAMTISDITATEIACDDENTMDQEVEYLGVLGRVEIWSIGEGFSSEESLLLRSVEDGLLVEAVPSA